MDPQGDTAQSADHQADYYDIGSHRLSILTQRDAPAQLQGFDGTDYALKAHLFGYLFNRENLSAVNRELAAATTLIALENTPNQLRSHLAILRNLGVNDIELQRMIGEIAQINTQTAEKARQVLAEMK